MTTTQTQDPPRQQQAQPISVPQREQQPASTQRGEPIMGQARASEYLVPSEPEPTLHPEVAEAGVEVLPTTPKLTKQETIVGIQHAKEAVPPYTEPSGTVKLPTVEEIHAGIKTSTVTSSRRWHYELARYVLKQLGLWRKK